IEKEFQRFATGTEKLGHEAEAAITAVLRDHFADKQGKLPKTLEQYLGDSGKMATMLSRLADPDSRSSLIGPIDSRLSTMLDTKVAVEAKDAKFELAKVSRELAEARTNRGAAAAVAVYAPGKLPGGFGPLTVYGSDVFCEFDPDSGDLEPVIWAVRVARLIALNAGRRAGVAVDAGAVRERLSMI